MRLIDLYEAIKLLRGECVAKYPTTFSLGLFASADELSILPEVDAVPVVRCRDCVYNENGTCTHSENYDDTRYRPDYFCADGERRNDDG